jgi:hypothetical protein
LLVLEAHGRGAGALLSLPWGGAARARDPCVGRWRDHQVEGATDEVVSADP